MSIRFLEEALTRALSKSREVGSPASEARLILFHVLRKAGAPLTRLTEIESAPATESLHREAMEIALARTQGRLLQHLIGYQFFLNHEYVVSPAVLIPRPETEILATQAIECARSMSRQQGAVRFAELGLGSGILSCELLAAIPGASGVASEASPEAVAIAKVNLHSILGAEKSGPTRSGAQSSSATAAPPAGFDQRLQILMTPSKETGFEVFLPHAPFDLVISNPPYVAPGDEIEAQVLREEPHAALFALSSVNAFYESFATHGRALLRPGGRAFFEIPHERVEVLCSLFHGAGFHAEILLDLTGRPRILGLL